MLFRLMTIIIAAWWAVDTGATPIEVIDVNPATSEPRTLPLRLNVVEDPSNSLGLAEVEKVFGTGEFTTIFPKGQSFSLGYTHSAWWVRFELKNSSAGSVKRMLEIAHSGLSQVDLFVTQDGDVIKRIATGRLRPFASRPVANRFFVFPLELQAKSEQVVWLRVVTSGPMHLPFILWQPEAFAEHERADYSQQALYFGVLAAMLTFNILLYLSLRERLYLIYVVFVICSGFAVGAQNGLTDEFLQITSPWWSAISTNVGYSLALGTLLLFMRQMLNTVQLAPTTDRVVLGMAIVLLLSPLAFAISIDMFIKPAAYVYFFSSILILSVSISSALRGQRRGYIFSAAYLFFCTAVVVTVLRAQGILPTNAMTINAVQIGSALEMLFLAFAIGDRFQEIRRQQENAAARAQIAEERSLAAEQIQDSERRYRTLIEYSSEGIAVHRNGIILYVNPAAVNMVGANSASDVVGRPILDFVLPEFHDLVKQRVIDAMHEDIVTPTAHERFRQLNGNFIEVEAQSTMIQFDGVPAIQVTIRDISVHARYQAELMKAYQAAESASLAKTRFLAAASHDLRQPIQAVKLFSSALARSPLTVEQQQTTTFLELSVRTLSDLLEALLDISKLDAGTVKTISAPVSVEQLISTVDREFSDITIAKGLRFKLAFPKPEMFFHTDVNILMRLLRNLIDNALRYTTSGGILVAIRRRGSDALFQVWDSGIGIAPKYQATIFEEYFQVDNLERDHSKGLGLGLSIVSRLGGLIGTKVTCRSRLEHGSVFEFKLPFMEATPAVAQPALASDFKQRSLHLQSADAGGLAGRRLVVIEDNSVVRDAIALTFESIGMSVRTFGNGEDALASADVDTADYFLSDLRLPGIDGLALLKQIQARHPQPIRAAVMTGDTSPDRLLLIQDSPWPVLYKPVDLTAMIDALITQKNAG